MRVTGLVAYDDHKDGRRKRAGFEMEIDLRRVATMLARRALGTKRRASQLGSDGERTGAIMLTLGVDQLAPETDYEGFRVQIEGD